MIIILLRFDRFYAILKDVFISPFFQDQLWRLFDLVPGLDYCELKKAGDNRGSRDRSVGGGGGGGKSVGTVVFNNPQSATYAKEPIS